MGLISYYGLDRAGRPVHHLDRHLGFAIGQWLSSAPRVTCFETQRAASLAPERASLPDLGPGKIGAVGFPVSSPNLASWCGSASSRQSPSSAPASSCLQFVYTPR